MVVDRFAFYLMLQRYILQTNRSLEYSKFLAVAAPVSRNVAAVVFMQVILHDFSQTRQTVITAHEEHSMLTRSTDPVPHISD